MREILAYNKETRNKILADCKANSVYDTYMDIKQEFSRRLREALLDKWPGMEKFIEVCLVLDVCVE